MTVLVTGAGLVGLHIAQELRSRGANVVLLDRRTPMKVEMPDGVRFECCDINDGSAIRAFVAALGVCDVVHTAAMLAMSAKAAPLAAIETNILSAVRLLDFAREGLVRRVLLASSASVNSAAYANAGSDPITEDFKVNVLSDGPSSFYIATKLSLEHFCKLYRDQYNVSATALRFGAVLGASGWQNQSMVGQLALQVVAAARERRPLALSDQRFLWSGKEEFVDPRDVAKSVALALSAKSLHEPVYNVTGAHALTASEFFDVTRSAFPGLQIGDHVLPETGFLGFPHPRDVPTDCSAAQRDLGFIPCHDVRDSLRYLDSNLPTLMETK